MKDVHHFVGRHWVAVILAGVFGLLVHAPGALAAGVAVSASGDVCQITADEPGFRGDTVHATGFLVCAPPVGEVTGTFRVCAQHLWRLGIAPIFIGPCTSAPVALRAGSPPLFLEATDSCEGTQLYRVGAYASLFDHNGNPFSGSDESLPLPSVCDVTTNPEP